MLEGLQVDDPRVLIGPGVGEDAAHISFGGVTLIAKADPVTFATDLIGWYAVNVNANDVAASGGTPRWFLATVLLPEGIDSGGAAAIFDQVKEAADELGVEVIGGHTEVTIGLPRPIVCGAMLGEAPAARRSPLPGPGWATWWSSLEESPSRHVHTGQGDAGTADGCRGWAGCDRPVGQLSVRSWHFGSCRGPCSDGVGRGDRHARPH